MNQPLTQQRLRITFGKQGVSRYIGHLDLAKAWERILRRAAIPLEYTQGFNPRPRMQFAAALPVGVTSESEYLDIWLTERLDIQPPDSWIESLAAVSPAGLPVIAITEVPIRGAALPTLVTQAEYVITLAAASDLDPGALRARVESLLAQVQIERVRRKKTYDLRPLIVGMHVDDDDRLIALLKTGDQGNARPDELLDALGLAMTDAHIHRRKLFLA